MPHFAFRWVGLYVWKCVVNNLIIPFKSLESVRRSEGFSKVAFICKEIVFDLLIFQENLCISYHFIITFITLSEQYYIGILADHKNCSARTRGLHGLKTEARTRPVPEIVWPDPTRGTVKFRARTRPEITPPPPPTRITKKRKKVAFHDCMQRNGLIKALPFHKHLPVMKVCEHQVQRSHTFCRVYEFCMDKMMMTVQIMVIFCQLRLVSILSTLNQT